MPLRSDVTSPRSLATAAAFSGARERKGGPDNHEKWKVWVRWSPRAASWRDWQQGRRGRQAWQRCVRRVRENRSLEESMMTTSNKIIPKGKAAAQPVDKEAEPTVAQRM
eukprot:1515808-Prymnesium_polylepis.1